MTDEKERGLTQDRATEVVGMPRPRLNRMVRESLQGITIDTTVL